MDLRDKTYLSIVNTLCDLTDDTKKGVAAIIVKDDNIISYGVNELPKGCLKLKERCEAPLKYNWILLNVMLKLFGYIKYYSYICFN
jgi:deoxycytidylate deaminase